MAIATSTAIILGAIAVGGATAYGANRQNKASKAQANIARDAADVQKQAMAADQAAADKLAAAPGEARARAEAGLTSRKRASARTKSVRTSPLGVAGEAGVARKTLLGM